MSQLSLQIGRFVGIGSLATFTHVGVAFLVSSLGMAVSVAANALGFACGVGVSYVGNFYWTFASAGHHATSIPRFVTVAVANLTWTTLVVMFQDAMGWSFVSALAIILATVPPVNFLVSKLWVFANGRTSWRAADLELPLLLALVAAAFWFYGQRTLNHDTSWYLIATARWLDGEHLYSNLMEINPPLAFFLTAPAILLARATGLAPMTAFVAVACGAITAALLWSRRILRSSPLPNSHEETWLLFAAFVALCITPIENFGQREHLMVILAMPYFLLVTFQPSLSSGERFAIGMIATLGLALKPHFLIFPAAIAVLEFLWDRHVRAIFTPEHWAIALGCIAYALFVWLVYSIYFDVIVPVGTLVYGAYRGIPSVVLNVPGLTSFIFLAGVFWWLRRFEPPSLRRVALTLLGLTAAASAAYLVQFKGWEYQRIPIYSMLSIAWCWFALRFFNTAHEQRPAGCAGAIAALMLAGAFVFANSSGPYVNATAANFARYIAAADGERSFLALTSRVSFTFPMANLTDAVVTSRYPALWLIPGAIAQLAEPVNQEKRGALRRVLQLARQTTTDDLVNGRPATVFVDTSPTKSYFDGVSFDYLDFFMQDTRFRKAWKDYRLVDTVSGYQVWQRIGADRKIAATPN